MRKNCIDWWELYPGLATLQYASAVGQILAHSKSRFYSDFFSTNCFYSMLRTKSAPWDVGLTLAEIPVDSKMQS